jgi:hypothetical protein
MQNAIIAKCTLHYNNALALLALSKFNMQSKALVDKLQHANCKMHIDDYTTS